MRPHHLLPGLLVAVVVLNLNGPAARAQNPQIGGVDCQDIEQNAGQTVFDPEGDIAAPGGGCPIPVNFGFDAGATSYWLDSSTGILYLCVRLHGNFGDADQDGGYNTKTTGCGGHPTCVRQESDAFGNIISATSERIIWYIDRDRNGDNDLAFRLAGSSFLRADSVTVWFDTFPNHVSLAGTILGGRGVAWQASPVQIGSDVVCVQDRNAALMIEIPDWRRYFTDDGTPGGTLVWSPEVFRWTFFLGNDSDFYTDDAVMGDVTSDVPESESSLRPLLLAQSPTPNPFHESVRMEVTLNGEAGHDVDARVFDISGRLVRNLGTTFVTPAERHTFLWDGRDESGARRPNGIYLIRLESSVGHFTSRVALVD
jgi:hypothetical protein